MRKLVLLSLVAVLLTLHVCAPHTLTGRVTDERGRPIVPGARSTNSVDPQAEILLDAVRNRSDAGTVFTVALFTSGAALLDAILVKRRIEFLGEELRSPDGMRSLLPIPPKSNVAAVPTSDRIIPDRFQRMNYYATI